MKKIILGSVQFGLQYGVSNIYENKTDIQTHKILDVACQNNINTIDTAPNYGNSEEIIGGLLKDFKCDFISKTPNFSEDRICERQIIELEKTFENSLVKLHVDSLYGLLVHRFSDLEKPGGLSILKKMQEFKEMGVVQKIGCSVYSASQIDFILDNFSIDIIQLPFNIFDQRLLKSGHLEKLKKYGVEIHARSVFLQGLLLMDLGEIPHYFSEIHGNLALLQKKSEELCLSKLELTLGFVNSVEYIDCIIVGVHNSNQLQEIINASLIKVNSNSFEEFSIQSSKYLNPSKWTI
jgi:aryl-alcohol dehydrogenase-like predicted oxidoreductase